MTKNIYQPIYTSLPIKVTKYTSNDIYLTINLTRSTWMLTNRIFILYNYITYQTKFQLWISKHDLQSSTLRSNTSTRTNHFWYQVSGPTVTLGHWNRPSRYWVWMVQMGVGTGTSTRPNQNTLKTWGLFYSQSIVDTGITQLIKYSQTRGYSTPK